MDLEYRFVSCRADMGDVPGFRGLELLRPADGGGRYFVVSWWDSDDSFYDWLAYGREMAHGVSSARLGVRAPAKSLDDLVGGQWSMGVAGVVAECCGDVADAVQA
ncbi:antibiotic biosynthesis monooxygenase [Pseudonocardia sp. ICBG1142]|uniref:antibiotic biosynthesis monooxygenase family protein n=1 Tax=Pseudonocardia sp. ICBG1142 TaxID=2846760 RepID=UPI001CF65863